MVPFSLPLQNKTKTFYTWYAIDGSSANLKDLGSEADQYHIAANLPLSECLFNLDNIKPTRRTIPKML